MIAKCFDPSFRYCTAVETSKPGYLAHRFATIYKPTEKEMNGHDQKYIDWLRDPEAQQDYRDWLDKQEAESMIYREKDEDGKDE